MPITPTDFDNAEIDLQTTSIVSNSKTLAGTPTDSTLTRLGDTVDTLNGRLKKLGYLPPVAYAGGIVFTALDNVKTVDESGSRYAPRVDSLPFTTSGTWIGDDENKFYLIEGATVNEISAEFETIADMVNGVTTSGTTIDFSGYQKIKVSVVYNNLTSKTGSAEYIIKTSAQVASDGDIIDGVGGVGGNHWLLGGTEFAAILSVAGNHIIYDYFGDPSLTSVRQAAEAYADFYGFKILELEIALNVNQHTEIRAIMRSTGGGDIYDVSNWQPEDLGTTNSRFISSTADSGAVFDNSYANYYADTTYIDVVCPYVVGIGDSIMMGRFTVPSNFAGSRLMQPSGGGFAIGYDPSYAQISGQTSWEVQRAFNVPFLNQGIAGQTTSQIWARWNRDVLAQTTAVGDGLPNDTLEYNGQKPFSVWIHMGVNDIRQGQPLSTAKQNFINVAQSCRDNGIVCIIDNIGPATDHTPTQTQNLIELNAFLKHQLKVDFPEIYLLDFMNWGSGGTDDPETLAAGLFEDELHPNRQGYFEWVRYVIDNYDLPINFNSMQFDTLFSDSSFPNMAKLRRFTFDDIWYEVDSSIDRPEIKMPSFDFNDNPVKRLAPYDADTIIGSGDYFGWCSITGKCSKSACFGSHGNIAENLVAQGTILSGSVSSSYPEFSIYQVDASNIASGYVTVRTTAKCKHIDINMIGTSSSSPTLCCRWSIAGHSDGVKDWNIYIFNSSSGAASTTLSEYNFQFKGWY